LYQLVRDCDGRAHCAVFACFRSAQLGGSIQGLFFSDSVDDVALVVAERLDGKLLLLTSFDDMDASAVVDRYLNLAVCGKFIGTQYMLVTAPIRG